MYEYNLFQVRQRCNYEWQLFRERMQNAEKSKHQLQNSSIIAKVIYIYIYMCVCYMYQIIVNRKIIHRTNQFRHSHSKQF